MFLHLIRLIDLDTTLSEIIDARHPSLQKKRKEKKRKAKQSKEKQRKENTSYSVVLIIFQIEIFTMAASSFRFSMTRMSIALLAMPLLGSKDGATSIAEIIECRKNCSSTKFQDDCSDYKDGLECDYNFIYSGCALEDIQCYPMATYTCSNNNWLLTAFTSLPCVGVPEDLPTGKECDPKPKKCPFAALENQSDCSDYKNDLSCNYKYSGCGKNDLQYSYNVI